ncbi:hypothetical protein BOX15_Mlig023103g2 [Macrostomum lignano]|uniref:Uncharacterized protein n=1 Tax=Macrostomum lignano TaxID=282301 RepID=A0A267GKV1_9PLAT|nr:hypothetical protein BOX15_Mlig023103g2 [Macrostomum lignano]
MPLTACQKAVAVSASAAAVAAAVLLWGVGAEAVYFGDYLHGSLLLTAAVLASLLESLTAWQYIDWRRSRYLTEAAPPRCRLPQRLLAVDTYRRAVAYALLSVPCFIQLQRLWLPILPGAMLLLGAALYTAKYFCLVSRQRAIVKVPTFVRFKDEAAVAETSTPAPASSDTGRLSHQSSFASTHSACSGQPISGSKDSGIEATQQQAMGGDEAPGKARRIRALTRACSSSPDRRCLITEEDSLSLHE